MDWNPLLRAWVKKGDLIRGKEGKRGREKPNYQLTGSNNQWYVLTISRKRRNHRKSKNLNLRGQENSDDAEERETILATLQIANYLHSKVLPALTAFYAQLSKLATIYLLLILRNCHRLSMVSWTSEEIANNPPSSYASSWNWGWVTVPRGSKAAWRGMATSVRTEEEGRKSGSHVYYIRGLGGHFKEFGLWLYGKC